MGTIDISCYGLLGVLTCLKDMSKVALTKKNASTIQKSTQYVSYHANQQKTWRVFSNCSDTPWPNKFKSLNHTVHYLSLNDIGWSWFHHWCFNPNLRCLSNIPFTKAQHVYLLVAELTHLRFTCWIVWECWANTCNWTWLFSDDYMLLYGTSPVLKR